MNGNDKKRLLKSLIKLALVSSVMVSTYVFSEPTFAGGTYCLPNNAKCNPKIPCCNVCHVYRNRCGDWVN